MTVKVSLQGVEELKVNMKRLADKYGEAFAKAAVAGGHMVRNDAVKSINQKSPGRTVTRSREGGGQYSHVAAAAGHAPNKDTGRLSNSIFVEVKQDDVFVGTSVEYAPDLEFGTKDMLPRPFLNPALEKNRRQIQKMFKESARKVTKGAGK